MSDKAWHEETLGAKDHPLHKTKMRCGCWTYYQRGTGMGIYTLLVHDSCQSDHEISVNGAHPQGQTPAIQLEVSTKFVETQLEGVRPAQPSQN